MSYVAKFVTLVTMLKNRLALGDSFVIVVPEACQERAGDVLRSAHQKLLSR